jgi:hypothetical protein
LRFEIRERASGIAIAIAGLVLALAAAPVPPSRAEVAQVGNLRIGVDARLSPRQLSRGGGTPVRLSLAGTIDTVDGALPPRLRELEIAINRLGRLDPGALPVCLIRQIQPATTEGALASCRRSLVGRGSFTAKVLLPEQSPFPSNGRVVAFNGRYRGRPAILAHVYGRRPAPTSFTLPFVISRGRGRFATKLTASLPRVATNRAYVTGLTMTLGGTSGGGRPYASAGCPAPAGVAGTVVPLVRAAFAFAGAPTIRSTLMRGCQVRG